MTSSVVSSASNLLESFTAACGFSGPLTIRATHRVTGMSRSYIIKQPVTFLGRAKGISIQLDDPSVSQFHAYLQVVNGIPHLIDMGSRTGVLWDDGTRARGVVSPSQTIRIGSFDLRFTGIAAHSDSDEETLLEAEPEEAPALSVLEVHAPNGAGGHFALDKPITIIGRHPSCGLRFLDDAIAYFHCALIVTQSGVWCVDLLTRKGTPINGRGSRLADLHDGDLIELGKVTLVYRDGQQPANSHPLVVTGSSSELQLAGAFGNGTQNALASAFAPLRDMMEQFQQSFVTMARMFTTMQQEQTAMMCEQMRQVQELLRDIRSEQHRSPQAAGTKLPVPPANPPTPVMPRSTQPKPTESSEARELADAHSWFFGRLAAKNSPAAKAD